MSNEFIVKFRPFDKVECCFDTLLPLLATMWPVSATMSNEISSFRQTPPLMYHPVSKSKLLFHCSSLNETVVKIHTLVDVSDVHVFYSQ